MQILNENGKTYLFGFMTEAETRNRNGRLYPKDVAKTATLELKERVDAGGVLSYLEHPSHSDLVREDACGVIVEVEWIDETGRATNKIEIFEDTASGRKVLEGIANNEEYGTSTRGLGSLDEQKVVQPGLKFVTSDVISNLGQSCQICTMSLTESVEDRVNTMDDYLLGEDCGCIYAKLEDDEKKIAEAYLVQQFTKCLSGI